MRTSLLSTAIGVGCLIPALVACDREPGSRAADAKVAPKAVASLQRASTPGIPFAIDADRRAHALQKNVPASANGAREVPFVSLRIEQNAVRLLLDPLSVRATLLLHDGRSLAFPRAGVPVALATLPGGGVLAIFRSFPSNRLDAVVTNRSGAITSQKSLGQQEDGYLFFRALAYDSRRLVIVLYDNRSRQNRLQRYPLSPSGLGRPDLDIVLPSLEDPAGGNYEMDPPIFLLPDANENVRVLGGTLDARLDRTGSLTVARRSECVRIIEAANTSAGVATLCDLKPEGADAVFRIRTDKGLVRDFRAQDGIPWRLGSSDSGEVSWSIARSPAEKRELFVFDVSRAQNSGLLELGSNNVEGRIPWAQVYYLNGMLDLLEVAARDSHWHDTYAPLIPLVRRRLELEYGVLDRVLSSSLGFRTRAFTVRREPALFAVQTSRLLALLERYPRELPGAAPSPHLERWKHSVFALRGHMEVVEAGGESSRWIPPNRRYLAWPRGSPFPFDGLPVPFNHQNEWAWSLFETARADSRWRSHPALDTAKDAIAHFSDRVLRNQHFPADGRWPYWWGRAVEGWSAPDNVSVNTPSYPGDKGLAWISFRTIDMFGVLSALEFMPSLKAESLLDSASALVANGQVYPFAAAALARHGRYPAFEPTVAAKFSRSAAPSDLQSAVWALGRPSKSP